MIGVLSKWFRKPGFLLALACGGCGSSGSPVPLGQVSGLVTLDGQPFAGALVQFNPEAAPVTTDKKAPGGGGSSAISDAEGKYILRFDNEHEGAVLGSHTVTVAEIQEPDPNDGPPKPLRIPLVYSLSSPFKFEVKDGSNTFNLELASQLQSQ
jgi:hypothetical protein